MTASPFARLARPLVLVVSFATAFATGACGGALGGPDTITSTADAPVRGAAVVLAAEPATPWPTDPVSVSEARVVGDSLHLVAEFGAGCRPHEFALVIGPGWRESYPVQVDALVSHNANGEMCRALGRRSLAFSLLPVRDAYRRAYRADTGTVALMLRPSGGTVRYAF